MISCFVAGNAQPTIPHVFVLRGLAVLGAAAADTRSNSWNGSHLYKFNVWMWLYGLGQAHKVLVAKALRLWKHCLREERARAGETAKQPWASSDARVAAD
jgi:hypothetical protein